MPKPIQVGRKERMTFAKINEVCEMPNLIEIQTDSYNWFMKYEQEECKERDVTYAAPLKVKVRLINKETGEVKEQEVFMGDFPLMTEKGTFIYNGAERVVVTQLVRSPGPYYDVTADKSNNKLFSTTIIPNRGARKTFDALYAVVYDYYDVGAAEGAGGNTVSDEDAGWTMGTIIGLLIMVLVIVAVIVLIAKLVRGIGRSFSSGGSRGVGGGRIYPSSTRPRRRSAPPPPPMPPRDWPGPGSASSRRPSAPVRRSSSGSRPTVSRSSTSSRPASRPSSSSRPASRPSGSGRGGGGASRGGGAGRRGR